MQKFHGVPGGGGEEEKMRRGEKRWRLGGEEERRRGGGDEEKRRLDFLTFMAKLALTSLVWRRAGTAEEIGHSGGGKE